MACLAVARLLAPARGLFPRWIEWMRNFECDHWRLYGCIRMILLIAAACCLVAGLDKITTWLLKRRAG
jgi:hypothetical protein